MKVKVGNCPCSWGVWYADGSPCNVPYERFLQQVSSVGNKYIELGPVGYLPQEVNVLQELLEKYNQTICAGTVCTPFAWDSLDDYIPTLKIQMETLKAFNAKYLVAIDETDVGECSINKKDWTKENYESVFQKIRDLDKYTMEEYGVMTVYHPHGKTAIETQQEIDWLMDATDVNLCMDTGHHAYINGKPEMHDQSAIDCIRKYADRVKYLHFKNVDPDVLQKARDENLDMMVAFKMDVMTDLEAGIVDFWDLKKVLEEIDYNGFGVIEQDLFGKPDGYALDKAKKNHAFLEKVFG